MTTYVTPVDPDELHRSPAFAQGMIAPAGPTLYVGGQNGTDASGTLLKGLRAQTEQALRNVLAGLDPASPRLQRLSPADLAAIGSHGRIVAHVLRLERPDGYAATGAVWGDRRTAVTVLTVTPARPGALVEIDAIAAIPPTSPAE